MKWIHKLETMIAGAVLPVALLGLFGFLYKDLKTIWDLFYPGIVGWIQGAVIILYATLGAITFKSGINDARDHLEQDKQVMAICWIIGVIGSAALCVTAAIIAARSHEKFFSLVAPAAMTTWLGIALIHLIVKMSAKHSHEA